MENIHEGGCLCGAVRYRVRGEPGAVLVCHCKYCQRRTSSAFAAIAAFKEGSVQFIGSTPTVYEHHSDESGRWLRSHFCSRCGTTVMLTLEMQPGVNAIQLGTFDDATWVKPTRHIWTRSKHEWVAIPADVKVRETV